MEAGTSIQMRGHRATRLEAESGFGGRVQSAPHSPEYLGGCLCSHEQIEAQRGQVVSPETHSSRWGSPGCEGGALTV